MTIRFDIQMLTARLIDPNGAVVTRPIEVRTNPLTGRRCRITFSRQLETEPTLEKLPPRPPSADDTDHCPFCSGRLEHDTPRLIDAICPEDRMVRGRSILFPNLFPYGAYSAVSLFDERHFVEIGTATTDSYGDSFSNCAEYLRRVRRQDDKAVFTAITQNHLPSAGGSLVHPHLQVHADRIAGNHHQQLLACAQRHYEVHGDRLISDYLAAEKRDGQRLIGTTGDWHWLAAFAPEGFFEIWAILSGCFSILDLSDRHWQDLARGVVNGQRFYRSLCRNGYNLGLISVDSGQQALEMRLVMLARSNYAPWVRSDHTGYETMLGDMATFSAPEQTAALARKFWQ